MESSFEKILMDGIADMVFVLRVEQEDTFIYDFINRAAIEGTGLNQHVIGQSIQEVHPKEMAIMLQEQYKKALSSGENVTYDNSRELSNGEKSYIRKTLTPLLNDKNQCTKIVAIVKDITKQRQAQLKAVEALDMLIESNNKFQSIFHHDPDAIFVLDLDGQITDGNKAVKNVTGYTPTELIGSTLGSLAISESVNQVEEQFNQAINGLTEMTQIIIKHKMGDHIHVSIKFSPVIIDGEVIGIYGILQDITDLVKSQKKLLESEERFRIIAENARDLITLFNEEGKIIYASPSYKKTLGFDYKEYIGNLFNHNVHPDDRYRINEIVLQSIKSGDSFTIQFKQYNNNGQFVWSEAHGTPVFDNQHHFQHMVVVTRDITLQKEEEMKLKHFALHDSLTGLPNRRLFKKRLEETLQKYQETKDKFAVMMLDLDNFKDINDQMGHDVGDDVIEEFGKRLRKAAYQDDTVARLGGDEFVILIPCIKSVETTMTMVQKIKDVVDVPWYTNNGEWMNITTSIGIAIVPEQGTTEEVTVSSMLKNADLALYEAKNAGRNGYKIRKGG